MIEKAKQIFDKALYFILLPVVSLLFILEPITNDIRIFMGVEYIADNFYTLPQGWDLAWEIKPMGNRLCNWALYKITSLITPMSNYGNFSIVVKVLALLAVILIAYYFAVTIKTEYAFPLTVLAFTAIGNISILQAEWWASLIGLLAIALLLHDKENLHLIAGALIVIIGLFKGITIFLFIPILCAVFLLKKDARIYWTDALAGFIAACLAFLICCVTIWPRQIPDILSLGQVVQIGLLPWWYFVIMGFLYFIQDTGQMPIIFLGTLFALFYLMEKRDIAENILFIIMWIVPFGIILIQSELMIYHYFILTIPAIVTFVLWTRQPTINRGVNQCPSK